MYGHYASGFQPITYVQSAPYVGTFPVTVSAGTPLTIEWACQDFQTASISYGGSFCTSYDAFNNCISYNSNGGSFSLSYFDYSGAVGTNFNAGTGNVLLGSATITPTATTIYGVYCKSPGIQPSGFPYNQTAPPDSPTMSFTVNVSAAPPTVSIIGNGTNPTPNAIVGQPVTIVGTFTPGTGDALTETAINDFANNLWCGSGCTPNTSMWTASPLGSKSYTFTPVSAGSYIFYPSVQTTSYPAWNNYSQSLTVTVANACQNGSGAAGSCTSCNAGYVLSGGSCYAQCPNGSGVAGSCTSCNAGYVLSGGNCAPTCPNGNGAAGSCSSCNAGYVLSGGNCVVSAPVSIITFSVNPTRVRKNTPTSVPFTWKVNNPPATCTISGPSGFTPLTISPVDGVTGSQSGTVNIAQPSYFTLTCGAVTKQITIGLCADREGDLVHAAPNTGGPDARSPLAT